MKKVGISIFGEAKNKAGVKAKSAKDDKEVVYIDGLESKLLELEFLKAQVKDLTAQEKAVNDEIKDISREKFVELYKANKENPNTFLIKDGQGCVMVIPTDSYKKIEDKDRANELMELYGDDVVTIEEKYYFNPKVLERNMAAVEKLIMDAKTISDDDKRNLLLPDIKYSITKGYIDKLSQYGNKMQTVIDDIQPTIALKNCGGKMEEGGMMGDDFIGNVYDNEEDDTRAENRMKFVVKNLEVQKELENYLSEISNKYFIDYGEELEEDGYDLDRLFNVSVFADTSIPEYVTSFTVPIDDDINFDIDNSIEEKFGDSVKLVPYYYKRGGKVDGRSTRAKDTWNSGASWTRDRNQFNKSQDWEVPMNKRKYAQGGGIDNEFILTYSKNVDAIYAFRKEGDEDGEGWIPSGRVVRSEDAVKKQVNSLADLAFVADLPMYDGVWTYDPIKNGAEIHFYRHTGYTTSGNLKLEIYYFIVEGDYKSKLESMSDYQLADLYIDDMGNDIDRNDLIIELRDNEAERKDLINKILSEKRIFGIDWLETACYNQNVKNGLREDVETIFQQYDYLNKFIEDKNDRIYAKGGSVPRNVGRDWLFKSKQDWEQKYNRKREYKEYKKEGWLSNWFKDGGEAKDLSQYTEAELYALYGKAEENWLNDNGAEYERIQAELDRRFYIKMDGGFKDGGEAFDYGSDLTDEAMVKNNLVDGEISADTLKQIIGCELSYPYQIVGAIKLQKCFMRPYYKLS
jgi:hypothetical protein